MKSNKTFDDLRKEGWRISVRTSVPTEEEIGELLNEGYEIEFGGLSIGVWMIMRKHSPTKP